MPVDPNQLSQDKDFLSAAPADQVKYLSAQDPDFAKAAPADQLGYLSHLTGKSANPAPNAGLAPPAGAPPKTLSSGEGPIAQGMTSLERTFADMPGQLLGKLKSSFFDKPVSDEVAGTSADSFVDPRNWNPVVREQSSLTPTAQAQAKKAGEPNPVDWGATAANALPAVIDPAGGGIMESPAVKLASAAKNAVVGTPKPISDMVGNTYSKTGDHLSSALRSNTKVDVPAEAKIASPAIEEGLNDRGVTTTSFKGRNGPAALQAGIDNAIDIQEARAKYAIDPIRGETVDPQVLSKNPELAARFADKDPSKLTYGDLDAERIKMNKELRTSNFYSKAPSAQYAVADPVAATHEAVNQARDLVYGKVGEVTGVDLRPLKATESALIKLGDLAETTKNTLSPKEAQFNTTPLYKKVGGSIKGALSVKANPINAFSIPEKTGLFNPLNEFNSHMQNAFPNLKASAASRTMTFPRYNLNLTSPGDMPQPMQQILNLSGGESIPGEDLKLSPPGDMPPDLQRVLPFQKPGIPSPLYPGAKK